MSIASRIEAIEQHLTDDYSVLEVAGADLTNVDKNIVNLKLTWQERLLYFINNGTDVVWNNWEKVTGEGETLTLNSTEEAPMKTNLNGNTSQETTTGSQLIDFTTLNNSNTTNSFINDTLTVNTSSGTYANAFKNITSIYKSNSSKVLRFDFTSLNSTTDLSGGAGYVRLRIVKTDNSVVNFNLVDTSKNVINYTIPSDVSDISSVSLTIYANNTGTTITNTLTINKPILHFGSASTDYEPYTNGASPNPDYPQDIHVVSGDNSINVCGKNLSQLENGSLWDGNGAERDLANSVRTKFIIFESGMTITPKIFTSLTTRYLQYCLYDSSKNFISLNIFTDETPITTSNTNVKYIRFKMTGPVNGSMTIDDINFMVVSGTTTPTTYEAYKGASYPISLGVENLFDKDNANVLDGMFINASAGNIGSNANATSIYIPINPNTTYCVSKTKGNRFAIGYSSTTPAVNVSLTNIVDDRTKTSLTSTSASDSKYLVIYISLSDTETYENIISTIQVEYGSKANSYTPFGTTPIELCKIGDYQDKIAKSTGKNLIGLGTQLNGYVDQSTLKFQYNGNAVGYYFSTSQLPDTITFGCINGNRANVTYFNETPAQAVECQLRDASNSLPRTINVNKTYPYMHIQFSYNEPNVVNIMLNEGSTALPYEPYGKIWYKCENIGKIVLNGSEDWTDSSTGNVKRFYTRAYSTKIAGLPTTTSAYCNYYRFGGAISNPTQKGTFAYNVSSGTTVANGNLTLVTTDYYTTTTQLKSALETNNAIIYHQLATPTYTEITDTTLLSQLEALNGAKSYTTQTNINQVNNDKPFILDATALKQLTQ